MDVAKARVLSVSSVLVVSFALVACNNAKRNQIQETTFPETKAECAATAVPNRFLVHWKDGTTSIEEAPDREAFIREILEPNEGEIEFAEHDQVVQHGGPDSFSVGASALEAPDWGQTTTGAYDVWNQGVKGSGVIVAVIDSGADSQHVQLQPRLAINPGEIAGNEIDDDGNGYIDDVSGYDFDLKSGVVTDRTGHGTHVSGTVLADHNTGPVRGMAPEAQLLPLDFMDDEGAGSLGIAMEAMQYAAARGAKVINASWGGAPCSKSLQKAILQLEAHGVLFVSAAGNSGLSLDEHPEYPAAYGLTNQITVGASTARDYTASFSNYSYTLVHLMAPGSAIYSTYPGNRSATMNGTSMATPFVSGAAALLWSLRPQATVAQIRQALFASVDRGNYAVSTGGRLNVRRALEELKKLLP